MYIHIRLHTITFVDGAGNVMRLLLLVEVDEIEHPGALLADNTMYRLEEASK